MVLRSEEYVRSSSFIGGASRYFLIFGITDRLLLDWIWDTGDHWREALFSLFVFGGVRYEREIVVEVQQEVASHAVGERLLNE